MEYNFQLGSFPLISIAEIINVLKSEQINYNIFDFDFENLHIEIENINPEVFLQILGGTRSITSLEDGLTYKQNIKEYEKREFKKPRVDPKSGLLPSKLTKMMINLSFTPQGVKKVYDPFCGGGTVITESLVMGIKGIGSDLEEATVKDARANAKWILSEYHLPEGMYEFFQSNVKSIEVDQLKAKGIDAIVSEPYMGIATNKPLRLSKNDRVNMERVNNVIEEALKKASGILDKGKRMVIIIPQFRTIKGIQKLEISEKFNRFSFRKVDLLEGLNIDKSHNLLYFRPKAIVLREIFILEKV